MNIKLLLTTSILALTPTLLSAQSVGGGEGSFGQKSGFNMPTTDFVTRKAAVNVEGPDMLTGSAFGVAVNGKTLSSGKLVNQERLNDIAMSRADISMRFDSKTVSRKLGSSVTFDESGKVHFMPYSNYPSFISKMELRFFDKPLSDNSMRPVFVVDVQDKTVVDLQRLQESNALNGGFTLRAYDSRGNYDETELMIIAKQKDSLQNADLFAGFGINRLAVQGISIRGGTVTVEGSKVRPESYVRVNKEYIPVDTSGNFVSELIVPNGRSDVQIEYVDANGDRKSYLRPVEIKQNDLFFFAMGDLTYGQNRFSGPSQIQAANPEEFEKEYIHGRAAFYLRGKVLGSFLITAMADTNEGDIGDIFSNFDEKDPRALLRRLDADKYYPVYGDDSSIEETAPTQGKMFIKVEHDKSYAMWGNFETGIFNDDFTHINRSLYGAKFNYESNALTSHGEAKTQAIAFVADPGTFATRDEFRGTGGSIYFLNYQDITVGSEKIRVEIRDRNSMIVNYVKELAYGKDYDIDYLQGRILLNEPLNSTASDGDVVTSSGSEFGDPVMLVVDYETTPLNVTLEDNQIAGGTVQKWFGDTLLVGATGSYENVQNGQNNTLYGANATLRYTPQTYIKGSYTESEGQSTEIRRSIDGGYSNINDPNRVGIDPLNPPAANDPLNPASRVSASGSAYMVELAVDAKDFNENVDGRLNAYYRDREAGFAGQGFAATDDTLQYGGAIQVGGSSGLTGKVEADIVETGTVNKTERYLGEVGYRGKKVFGTVGVGLEKDNTGAERTNVGARAGYNFNGRNSVYAFGQYTIDAQNTQENHRVGVGANVAVTDKITAGGEVAVNEDTDVTARVSVDYAHDDDSNYYLAYDINADRNNFGSGFNGITGSPTSVDGALVVGGRQRYGSSLSVFGEENFYHGTGNSGLTHTYGVDYTPWNDVTLGANVEVGEVSGLDRKAVSANIGYGNDNTHASLAGEYRDEKNVGSAATTTPTGRETQTYVVRANARHEINDELSLIARGNASFSENNDSNVEDGEFAEGSIGFAYRPNNNDRLNILGRYSYLYDLATAPQIASGTAVAGQQKAHLASIDFSFDFNKYLTIGGKYGYKSGQINTGSGWTKVQNHLGIFRADLHVVHKWDLMLEGRMLWQEETETIRYGALAGVYYHLNDNVKVGGGYSWSEFDDDLANFGFDNSGWFVNLITKF